MCTYAYVIGDRHGSSPLRIGYSRDPEARPVAIGRVERGRMQELGVAPHALELLASWPALHNDEQRLHDALSVYRISGGWFHRAALAWLGVELPYTTCDLSPAQIGRRLSVSRRAVVHWINTGELRAKRSGGGNERPRYAVSAASLDRFIRARHTTPRGSGRQELLAALREAVRLGYVADADGCYVPPTIPADQVVTYLRERNELRGAA